MQGLNSAVNISCMHQPKAHRSPSTPEQCCSSLGLTCNQQCMPSSYVHSCQHNGGRRKATDAGHMVQQQLTATTPVSHTHTSICLSLELIARRAAMKSVGSHSYSKLKSASIIACINHSCCIQQLLFKSTALHDVSLWAMRLLGILH